MTIYEEYNREMDKAREIFEKIIERGDIYNLIRLQFVIEHIQETLKQEIKKNKLWYKSLKTLVE